MLRRVTNTLSSSNPVLGVSSEDTRRLDPFLTFVRWRKRRWAPITPSKLFRVKVQPVVEPGEKEELKKLYDHYRTTFKSIRSYLKEDLASKTALLTNQSQLDVEQQHYVVSQQKNSEFNQRSAEYRRVREVTEKKLSEEKHLEMLLKKESEEKLKLETARRNVLTTMRESSQFVSRDTLQSSIEKMLDERRLFNFAIDLEGQRHVEQADGSITLVSGRQTNSGGVDSEHRTVSVAATAAGRGES